MTRETKIGIAMVLLLVGVFGFLVYKRFTRPVEAMAESEQQAVEEEGDAPEGGQLEWEPDDELPTATRPNEPKILPVAGNTRQMPPEEPGDVDDPFSSASDSSSSSTAASSRPRLPTVIPDDEPEADDREAFVSDIEENESAVRSDEPDIDGKDPFLDSPGATRTSAPNVVSSPAAVQFDEKEAEEDDTFVTKPVVRNPVVSSPVQPNITSQQPEFSEPDTVSVQARAQQPEPSFDFGEEALETEAPELAAEPERPAIKSPAPQLMLDDSDEDRYGGYEPIELVDAQIDATLLPKTDFFAAESPPRRGTTMIAGDSHVVQPGENFWSISQKKYGTGRYFQALAAYNQAQVPDAAKMKSGVTVALPTADELERRYPQLIPKGGPSEPAAADGQANQPGELLTGQDGRPLYRIGARDTLSGISQKYLGRSSRWMQIFEMNRDVLKDGNSLKVGAVLRLPPDAGEFQLSNQPRAFR